MAELTVRFELSFGARTLRCLLVSGMIFSAVTDVASESVTLTTYYPAPSGVYTQMITTGNTYLARDAAAAGGTSAVGIGVASFVNTSDSLEIHATVANASTYFRILGVYAQQSAIAFDSDASGAKGLGETQDSVIYRPGSTRDLAFWTATVGDAMYIQQAGKIGIGMNAPDAQLAVNAPAGSGLVVHGISGDNWFPYGPDGKNYLRGTTILADTGGKVGIGTANPAQTLDVNGGFQAVDLVATDAACGEVSYIEDGTTDCQTAPPAGVPGPWYATTISGVIAANVEMPLFVGSGVSGAGTGTDATGIMLCCSCPLVSGVRTCPL